MDVVNADQARIAEEAGACAVMALERVPAGKLEAQIYQHNLKNHPADEPHLQTSDLKAA